MPLSLSVGGGPGGDATNLGMRKLPNTDWCNTMGGSMVCGKEEIMWNQKHVNGYFSVEAALVLPIVLGVYLFLIAILFVQYDRCLLEQDMASMLIKASNRSGTPQQQLEYLQELTTAWDREQYLWVQPQSPHFTIQGKRIHLEAAGDYGMPVFGNLVNLGGPHQIKISYRLYTWDRTTLARILAGGILKRINLHRKFLSGLNEDVIKGDV